MAGYDRCRHSPLCLSPIFADDVVVLTEVGYALTEHVLPVYPQEPLPLEVSEEPRRYAS